MKLTSDKIKKLAQTILSKFIHEKLIVAKVADKNILAAIEAMLFKDTQIQQDIEAQARKVMDQFRDKIQSGEIDYQKMHEMVLRQLLKEKKLVSLKYSEERIKDLAFKIHDRLYMDELLDYTDEELALTRIKEVMLDYFALHDQIVEAVRVKISTLKKLIIEGSAEWEVLYNKYLAEELQKKKM